jgi:integrase
MLAQHDTPPLAFFIKWYIDTYKDRSDWQRSKQAHLEQLMTFDITKEKPLELLTSTDFIEHISGRLNTCKPVTAANDIIWMRVVIKSVLAHFPNLKIDLQQIENASTYLRQNKMIGKPSRRERRPTMDELKKLDEYFLVKDQGSIVNNRDIMWFATFSARRQSEITRLRWEDYSEDGVILVRDLKHPTKKKGNNKWSRLTIKAQEIINRQPREGKYIFPFNHRTISGYFTRACKLLEIENLRFHDLRHEATSRFFEQGYSIVEVQQFTLHESWQELSRYTNLRPHDVVLREIDEVSDIRVIQLIKDDLKLPHVDLSDVFTLEALRDKLTAGFGSDIAADATISQFRKLV